MEISLEFFVCVCIVGVVVVDGGGIVFGCSSSTKCLETPNLECTHTCGALEALKAVCLAHC